MALREYGGYIEFETYCGREFHQDAIALNCGRNCLAFLIEKKNIKKIYLPYFLCSSVKNTCEKYNIEICFYHTDKSFRPLLDFTPEEGSYLYLVNYYGQIGNEELEGYCSKYSNVIVDNAQAFFQKPLEGVDTLVTCRKYFGVADGAYLYSENQDESGLDIDYSFDRMRFLTGRFEKSANEFYSEYVANNRSFRDSPVLRMSVLTANILRSLDYQTIANRRTENFKTLHSLLGNINNLNLSVPYGAFMYPLYIEQGEEIRKELQKKKIYIPTLWPDVFEMCEADWLEYKMAKNILPIPVDQRYGDEDMNYLAKEILKCIN